MLELLLGRQAAQVVALVVVLAQHERAPRAGRDVVGEVEHVAALGLVDAAQRLAAGVVAPDLPRPGAVAGRGVRPVHDRPAALRRGEVDDAVVVDFEGIEVEELQGVLKAIERIEGKVPPASS